MTPTHRGIIRGKTIELIDDPGIEEGRQVEVVVRVVDGTERERTRMPAQPAEVSPPEIRTAGDLLDSGIIGIWADRADLGDGREFAARLRRQAESRHRPADAD